MAEIEELSEREREILSLVAKGASNKEIASQLYISTNTVKVHLRNIFSKTGAASRTEAAMIAVQCGLVDVPIADQPDDNQEKVENELVGEAISSSITTSILRRRTLVISILLVAILVVITPILYLTLYRDPGQISATASGTSTIPQWRERASLPTARQGLALAAYDEKIYAIAGETSQSVTGILELYDPQSDRWRELAPKPEPVAFINAAVIVGKLFVPGGQLISGEMTDILEIYDPSTDKWTRGASLPLALSAYSLVTYEGNVYLFGGWDGANYLDTVLEYNPATDQWTEKTPMPTARAFSGATVAGGKIHVIGGSNETGPLGINEVYLPYRETGNASPWTPASPMPEYRSGMSALTIADLILIVGGESKAAETISNLEYNNVTDKWRAVESPVEQPWSYLNGTPLGTTAYLMGGKIGSAPTSMNIAYQALYNLNVPIVR